MNKEKNSYFSLSIFLPSLLILTVINVFAFQIILFFYPDLVLVPKLTIALSIYWCFVAFLITCFVRYNAIRVYEQPIKRLAAATSQVAKGDFSVYVEPVHTLDKQDYLDVMINDFNKMVEELGSVEILKTDFFSNVSHEIKTPITIIQNYAQLLNQPNLSENLRLEYATAIIKTSLKLSNLITNILKLNKLEKQTISINSTYFNLSNQLTNCILNLEYLWEKKCIDLEVDIEESCYIESDIELLEIVWDNLLTNAIKFTDKYCKVKIKQYVDNNQCFIQFIDEGCGMDEKTKKHIFDKFYQGDSSHASEGNGLGLAMVYRIIELISGKIRVESQIGIGSIFTVILPIRKEQIG